MAKLLEQKSFLITGASRGIGKAIALRLAEEGAQIAIASKSVTEDERLGGTIYSAAKEIENAGGKALPIACDIRDEAQIINAINQCKEQFGKLDGVINNASAIYLSPTIQTPSKRFDLMFDVNVRGTFLVTSHAYPLLCAAEKANVITLSPPVNLQPHWLAPYPAYTLSKYNMTLLAMAWAEEWKGEKIASSAIWPATTIATAAVNNLLGGAALMKKSRTPDIVADAVFTLLQQPYEEVNGKCFLDETLLAAVGETNFSKYAVEQTAKLQKDLFLD